MSDKGKVRFNRRINRYYVDIYWNGQRHHLYRYLGVVPCSTQEMADVLLREIRTEIDKGIFNPLRYKKGRPLHLRTYAKTWLESHPVSEATRHDYQNSLRNHILPILGDECIADITYSKLKRLQAKIKRTPKGKKNVMGCLHKLLKDAYLDGKIAAVPEFPGFTGTDSITTPAIKWIEDADQWKVINHIPVEDRPIFIFMKLTGCRPSEARALRKQDIKPEHVGFNKTFGRGEILKEVKSKRSRTFPMIEALQELFNTMPTTIGPWVFTYSKTGKPYTKNINRLWNAACDAAEVVRVPLNNACRHSWGCQMLNAGIDKAVVQRLLGHSDPRMTDRYAEHSTNALKIRLDNVIKMPGREKGNRKQTVDLGNSGHERN